MSSMSQAAYGSLPDPDLRPDFYRGVPIKRLVAWVIDTLACTLLTGLVILLTAFVGAFFLPIVFFLVSLVYRAMSLANWGATPGMLFVGVRIFEADGQRVSRNVALLHTLGFLVVSAMVLPLLISCAVMLLTERGQSLVDLVLGTVVLNRASETYY